MKETWNVVLFHDVYAEFGWTEILIGDPEEISKFCDEFGKENVIQCWIDETYEVERV